MRPALIHARDEAVRSEPEASAKFAVLFADASGSDRTTSPGACIKPAAGVTRTELAEVARRAMPANEYLGQHEAYMAVFDANVPLDGASDLIFYPPDYDPMTNTWGGGRPMSEYDPTPEQIVEWALGSTGGEPDAKPGVPPEQAGK